MPDPVPPSLPPRRFQVFESLWAVAAMYVAVVVALRWPLALGLTTDLPADLGDPAFVSWAIARASMKWTALLGGDFSAATNFWDARIFHPQPLTGAYSEHFVGHALLTLPAWWLTHNVLLSYNLLFLGSAVLCGIGMYLLVRDLTGLGTAAFVAGLCFACAPYRVSTSPHLQVQSAQWLPFALLGLRRFILSGRWTSLAGAVGALWLQNLASGYYMLFFAPLAGLWSVCWLTAERQWANAGRVTALVGAGVLALLLTLPFALPYLTVRRYFGATGRPIEEAAAFSADLAAWLTASPLLNLWGWVRVFPRAEGELFMGVALPLLAVIGVASAMTSRVHKTVTVFALVTGVFAIWMALGPTPSLMGKPVPIPSLFAVAYNYIPGFSVARVPARFHMTLLIAGTLLAGLGAGAIAARPWLLGTFAALAILDGAAVPFPRNTLWAPTSQAQPPPGRLTPTRPPRVYGYLATLGPESAIVHFPLGAPEHEIRYMFYSATFPSSMVNGYSGSPPPDWGDRIASLTWPLRDPDRAWAFMRTLGVTHAVVHDDVWRDDTGPELRALLAARGAKLVFHDGPDAIFQLPPQ